MDSLRHGGRGAALRGMAIFVLLLSSCTQIGKPYEDVQKETVDQLQNQFADSKWVKPQSGDFAIKKDWWKAMGDPELDRIIDESISKNLDMALLVNRVRSAEIELKGAQVDEWPTLSATASYTNVTGDDFNSEGTAIGAGLSWEADLWGRLSQKKQAQLEEYRATEADWRAGYLMVVNGVAKSYITIRRLDEQSALHNKSLEYANEILLLYKIQQEAGLVASDTVATQQAEIHRLEGQLKEITRIRQLVVNELALLSGASAEALKLEPANLRSNINPVDLPETIAADLLIRRPDVVAAELRVKSAYSLQESTRAARWPKVSIGVFGQQSSSMSSSWIGLILPKISFPALDPQTKIRLQLSEEALLAARNSYKKTVLSAIREAADSVVNLNRHQEQLDDEKKRMEQLEVARKAVNDRVVAGLATKVELLLEELKLLAADQRQLDLYTQILIDQTQLHSALGGGW